MIKCVEQKYKEFLHLIAKKYIKCNALKEFPFKTKLVSAEEVQFLDEDIYSLTNLSKIAFFCEYTIQD
jgi:hypothetical protein